MPDSSPQRRPNPAQPNPVKIPLVKASPTGPPVLPGKAPPAKIPLPSERNSAPNDSSPGFAISTEAKKSGSGTSTRSSAKKGRGKGLGTVAFLLFGLIGLGAVAGIGGVVYVMSLQPAKTTVASAGDAKKAKPAPSQDASKGENKSAAKKKSVKNSPVSAFPSAADLSPKGATSSADSGKEAAPETSTVPAPPAAVPAETPEPSATKFPVPAPSEKPETPGTPGGNGSPTTTAPPPVADEERENNAIHALFTSGKLLLRKEYPTLRKIYADRFARAHDSEIRQGLGKDADEALKWLDEHADIKEELYTALGPHDKVPQALTIFNELRKKYPAKIVPYASLAIATAVVWDEEKGIQEYTHDVTWTKSIMPSGQLAMLENFKYLMEAEPWMQGRIQYVPWEFLVYVVNHRTPLDERQWAVQNYLDKRVMFGKCYSDVPYDYQMLDSNLERPKLAGQEYSLPNLRSVGGICEMQADYASRVGKSLGVPAAHVSGKGAFGGAGHAWVMWVELKQATPTGIVFTLESHGRYFNDRYYVGNLEDPQTGQPITDRDMELRLQTVGMDVIGKRHSALVMQAYPMIKEKSSLDAEQQLRFLGDVITACPGNEEAWMTVARLGKESAGEKKLSKQFNAVLDRLFITFAKIPDFTWKVFDDLAAFSADTKQRNKLYERLVALYELAGRPDLAVEARLRLTDFLLDEKREVEAIQGLAITVKKFPDEGNLVPRLLDKIELICANHPSTGPQLVQFYTQFLPLIPQKRFNRPSDYCMDMYKRAIQLFNKNNQPQLVEALQLELTKIQAAQPK